MRNILHIMPDQMRHDALGCRGVFPVQTPNMDALVDNGVTFKRAYCANPLCVPSRTSLMTGRPCHDHGVYYNSQPVPNGMDTLQGILAANGYYTVSVGKMHFNPTMAHYGFHKRVGDSVHYQEYLTQHGLKLERAHANPSETNVMRRHYLSGSVTLPMEHYMPVYRARCAMDELEKIAATRQAEKGGCEPFYMWLGFSKPHSPCDQPEPYFSMYDPVDIPPPVGNPKGRDGFSASLKRWSGYWTCFSEQEKQQIRAQYLGSVSLVDELIGQIIKKLKDLNLYDNTLIVLDADHGDLLGDHGLEQKAFFFESSVRVPLVFSGPGVQQGQVVEENVSLLDVFPTLLDYCGLRLPELPDVNGNPLFPTLTPDAVSLLPVLEGEKNVDPNRLILSESGIHDYHIMLLRNRTKLNYYQGDDSFELYHRDEDSDEADNLAIGLTSKDLPPELAGQLPLYLEKAMVHANRSYFYEKPRKMFT